MTLPSRARVWTNLDDVQHSVEEKLFASAPHPPPRTAEMYCYPEILIYFPPI